MKNINYELCTFVQLRKLYVGYIFLNLTTNITHRI